MPALRREAESTNSSSTASSGHANKRSLHRPRTPPPPPPMPVSFMLAASATSLTTPATTCYSTSTSSTLNSLYNAVPAAVSGMVDGVFGGGRRNSSSGAGDAGARSNSYHSENNEPGRGGPNNGNNNGGGRWWRRMIRRRRPRDMARLDQELYIRTLLESYCSSISSNRYSSAHFMENGMFSPGDVQQRSLSSDEIDSVDDMYEAGLDTPNLRQQVAAAGTPRREQVTVVTPPSSLQEDIADSTIGAGDYHSEKNRRRLQRRLTQQAMKAKIVEKNEHRARARKKFLMFLMCVGITLSAFLVAAVLIARVGVKTQNELIASAAENSTDGSSSSSGSSAVVDTLVNSTDTNSTGAGSSASSVLESSSIGELPSLNDSESSVNESGSGLPSVVGRSGIDLVPTLTPTPTVTTTVTPEPTSSAVTSTTLGKQMYTYAHCLLMSLSLWMSLVVIAMHMTFRSFRTYSLAFVLELSCVQCGYWITSLLRVQFDTNSLNNVAYLFFCMSESFFNFGQISFTCAIAFNMYRSVVSFADVLLDSQSAKVRYRSYSMNVMLLSMLGSITLSLVGYRSHDVKTVDVDYFQPCLYPTCRLILYVYYPLLAFFFNFIFYIRFKRTIGEAYPMSATGRLNKVARSYLVLFVICWGSLILLTAIEAPDTDDDTPRSIDYVLQCIFDFLGVGTAVITLTNFHRCRRAFDFGLSLKAIDPNSIEFDEPLQILGEGTFALVLKAKWHQGPMDNSISRTVEVAVKTFKHTQFECLDQMKEEAYLSSKLVHPCVMMTYGCYTNGSNLYIVSEYLGGGTLQDVIDANTSLPYEKVLRYAHMVAMGMRFLHGLPVPIIHRYVHAPIASFHFCCCGLLMFCIWWLICSDLKPLNCIFDSEQEMLKLADFGESRLFRKEGGESVTGRKTNFFPAGDLTIQMTTNIGSACWAVRPSLL